MKDLMPKHLSERDTCDPIAAARANWERAGWGEVADGMMAVTSVMRAHQILLARVENALRPYDLSFSASSYCGCWPSAEPERCRSPKRRIGSKSTSPVSPTRFGAWRPTDWSSESRTPPMAAPPLVQITDLGRSTVEDATVTLNEQVFADVGMSAGQAHALVESIETLRHHAGDF